MRLLDIQLVLDKTIHPQYVVVLSFQLQLVADQKGQFFLCLVLQFLQCLLENRVELLLYMGCLCVDLLDFKVNFAEIVCQLIFPPLYVGVDFLHLR